MSISIPHAEWWEQLQGEISTNPFYDSVVANTVYKQRDGVWFQNGKVFFQITIIFCFHKTLSRLRGTFHWAGMHETVKNFLQQCDIR